MGLTYFDVFARAFKAETGQNLSDYMLSKHRQGIPTTRVVRDLDALGFHVSVTTALLWLKKFKAAEVQRLHDGARNRVEEERAV